MPVDLGPVLAINGFDGCVAVQADQTEAENDFLLAHAAQYDFIKGVVGWVDLQADNLAERLAFYSESKKMKGFRHILQGEQQRDFMLRPAFLNGIKQLKAFGYTYDILIHHDQLQYAADFISRFPDQPFVIDHIAKPDIKNREIDQWAKDIKEVAKFENVLCKVSGMVTEADFKNWKPEDFTPYLDVVAEAFDTKRLMYGSDWPVCLVAADYGRMAGIVKDYFSSFSSAEQGDILGGNATRFYNLS